MNNSRNGVKPSLLLVEDDAALGEVLAAALGRRGFDVDVCRTVGDARAHVAVRLFEFAVVDLRLPDGSGLSVVQALKNANAATSTLVLTGYANIATAIEAIKLGAKNYLCKPLTTEAVVSGLVGPQAASAAPRPDAPLSVPRLEWEHIMRVRAENKNNISATARALGMHRRTLQRKLSKHHEPGEASEEGVNAPAQVVAPA